jgi:hypothetical protein
MCCASALRSRSVYALATSDSTTVRMGTGCAHPADAHNTIELKIHRYFGGPMFSLPSVVRPYVVERQATLPNDGRRGSSRLELACVDCGGRWRRTVALADRLWVKDELDPDEDKLAS